MKETREVHKILRQLHAEPNFAAVQFCNGGRRTFMYASQKTLQRCKTTILTFYK